MKEYVKELKKELELRKSGQIFQNPFIFDLYKSSVEILESTNKLAFNFFCLGIRECIEKTLQHNDEEIKKCIWFGKIYPKSKPQDNNITTKERLFYLFAGGLRPEWFDNFDRINEDISNIYSLYNNLSKLTHLNELVTDDEKDKRGKAILFKLKNFANAIRLTKSQFDDKLSNLLSDNIGEHIRNNFLDEIDEICTHYYDPIENVREFYILEITDEKIVVDVEGTIQVTTQWGSDKDVSRGDGDVSQMDLPFSITLSIKIDIEQPSVSGLNEIEIVEPLKIDNSSFYE